MNFKKLLAASIAIAALTACTGEKTATSDNQTSTSSSTTSATSNATKSTPTKTPEGKSLGKSTSPKANITSGGRLLEVKASDLTNYTYKTGLFSLDIPKNWKPDDSNTKAGEVTVLWSDPTENSSIIVNVFNAPPGFTPDKLAEALQTYVKTNFGSNPDFAMEEPVKQTDGSMQIAWGYPVTVKVRDITATGWL